MPIIEFYPLDLDAVTSLQGRIRIRLFGRTPDGRRVCAIDDRFEPYFFIVPTEQQHFKQLQQEIEETKHRDGERLAYVTKTSIETKKLLGKPTEVLKVIVNHPRDIKIIADHLKNHEKVQGIYETDINATKRYLLDNNISPLISCKVEGEETTTNIDADITLKIKSLTQTEGTFIKNPKILAIDIEVYNPKRHPNAEEDPILMVAFYGNDNYSKVITWKEFSNPKKHISFVKDEGELILKCKEVIQEYKPDYLVGYYSDGFDLPYLKQRAGKYNITLNLGMDKHDLRISSTRALPTAKIKGIVHLDIYKFIKRTMKNVLDIEEYDLDTVAQTLLGEGKTEQDIEQLANTWDNNPEGLKEYCEYNLQDAKLTHHLVNKLMPNINELTKLIPAPLHDLSRMTYGQLVEYYILTHIKESNELIQDKPTYIEMQERKKVSYTGGLVHEPQPGLYEDIIVFDFRSLLPSIMSAHNICPTTLTTEKEESKETPETTIKNKKIKYYFSYKQDGYIPILVKGLLERRNRIKAMTKKGETIDPLLKAREHTLKILLNSFYGYLAYPGARWYSLPCAAAISAYGRDYIKQVIQKAEEKHFKVIYSDTDSIFLSLQQGKTKENALELLRDLNHDLPSLMELEYEEHYKRGLFVEKKTETKGAKKKYALLDEKNNIHITGFETIRGDWSVLAREVQDKLLHMILQEGNKEQAIYYVKEVIKDVKSKKIAKEKMVMKKQMKKNIKDYENIGPHVAVAKKLEAQGETVPVGSIVEFVICQGEGSISERAKPVKQCENYDIDYYINNQIVPVVEKILEALGYPPQTILDEEQSTVGDF